MESTCFIVAGMAQLFFTAAWSEKHYLWPGLDTKNHCEKVSLAPSPWRTVMTFIAFFTLSHSLSVSVCLSLYLSLSLAPSCPLSLSFFFNVFVCFSLSLFLVFLVLPYLSMYALLSLPFRLSFSIRISLKAEGCQRALAKMVLLAGQVELSLQQHSWWE